MKKSQILLSTFCFLLSALSINAQNFDQHFSDRTLRLDYTFTGNNHEQRIYLDQLTSSEGWFGRRGNLDKLPLKGNGQITVTDTTGTVVLYRHSFSSLFQEWVGTEEASRVSKSFENCFYIPMPSHKVRVDVTLYDSHQRQTAAFTHVVDPEDILIRKHQQRNTLPWQYLKKAGDSREKIDVVFVPEGYTKEELDVFHKDCEASIEALLKHAPFSDLKESFNFICVDAPSQESGVSIPHDNLWVNTLVGSHFDTFYSNRYLTTLNLKRMYNALDGVPCETIIILANTENYGGGGIYNSYTLSAAHNEHCLPVVVHEFGHSFAALADEYFYDDQYEPTYPAGVEPWEQNITTLTDFDSKWKDMIEPSAAAKGAKKSKGAKGLIVEKVVNGQEVHKADGQDIYTKVGVYEGAGYQSKGCYRPAQECRMKINAAPEFCPVCQRAIRRLVEFLTK